MYVGKIDRSENSKNVVLNGVNMKKLKCWKITECQNRRGQEGSRRKEIMPKASQGRVVSDTGCWQQLEKKINASCALMTTQAKSCRGPKSVNFVNKNFSICAISECVNKGIERKAMAHSQVISVDTKWIETGGSPWKSGHEL